VLCLSLSPVCHVCLLYFGTRLTALVVKVLSMLAERQSAGVGMRSHRGKDVTNQDISHAVHFLVSVQEADGSFSDPHPVVYRAMQVGGWEEATSH